MHLFSTSTGTAVSAPLQNASQTDGDRFGTAVAIDGNTIAIGSRQRSPQHPSAGAVHLYRLDTPQQPCATVLNPQPQNFRAFGAAVALGSGIVAATAIEEQNSQQFSRGRVHFFAADTGKLINSISSPSSDLENSFGANLGLAGNRLAVSADAEDVSGVENAGAVYVFNVPDPTGRTPINALLYPIDVPQRRVPVLQRFRLLLRRLVLIGTSRVSRVRNAARSRRV